MKYNDEYQKVSVHCEPKWSMRFGNAIMCDFEFDMNLPSRNVDKVLKFHNLTKKYTFLVKKCNFWNLKVRLNFNFQPFEGFLYSKRAQTFGCHFHVWKFMEKLRYCMGSVDFLESLKHQISLESIGKISICQENWNSFFL